MRGEIKGGEGERREKIKGKLDERGKWDIIEE